MAEKEEDILKRWSRRKAEIQESERRLQEGVPDQDDLAGASPIEKISEEGAQADPDQHQQEIEINESEFDDVDFDRLDFSSDFTRFMEKGVPEFIQRRALRKLWASDPILANLDGLNDYDEDFTDAALAVKVLKTAYKVGSGYMTDDDLQPDEIAQLGEEKKPDDDIEAPSSEIDTEPEISEANDEDEHVSRSDEDDIEPSDETLKRKT